MTAFKRFGPGDQADNVLILEPSWKLASGTTGWKGSPEGSASVSLHGGTRRSGVVRESRFQRTIPGTDSYGPLIRKNPVTASVHFAWVTDEPLNLAQRTSERWGYDHWKTVMGLYDYHSRHDPDYTLDSYNHYCLYFQADSLNIVSQELVEVGTDHFQPTASFTVESWIKPFASTSPTNDFTVQSYNSYFWLGLTGSTGRVTFSSPQGTFTSSIAPSVGEWHHLAVSLDGQAGTFYVDLAEAGTFTLNAPLDPATDHRLWTVGNVLSASAPDESYDEVGSARRSFHGLLGESRLWASARSWHEISGTHNRHLIGSELSGASAPIGDLRFADGPLTTVRWPQSSGIPTVPGSGALNVGTSLTNVGRLLSFDDRYGPVWHPNDNGQVYVLKETPREFTSGSFSFGSAATSLTEEVRRLKVLSIPQGFFGRRVVPGSVRLTCNAFDGEDFGLIRTLVDDGRGGLYMSGSCFGAEPGGESVYWNKVGNVFYDEGLVVIKDPALLDFGDPTPGKTDHPADVLQVDFRGDTRIPVKTLMCRIDRGDLNASLNSTFWRAEEDGSRIRRHPSGSLYVTTVNLYNDDHELVGVARLAEPLRVRPRDRFNIRLRLDF